MTESVPLLSLADYRQMIDSIDMQILSLLKQRSEVVTNIRTVKSQTVQPPVDFAREDAQMARYLSVSAGFYSPSVVYRIFREIIMASIFFQGTFRIGMVDDFNAVSAVRTHFCAAPISFMENDTSVLDAVAHGDVTVGIVPAHMLIPKHLKTATILPIPPAVAHWVAVIRQSP